MKLQNPFLKKERLEAFCDGVFAIAITILVLEIKVPKHEELNACGGLYGYMVRLWPSYLSYVVSFLTVGVYWSNNHWLFSFIKKTNHVFNLLNIIELMTISLMPFTTAIISEYVLDPEYRNAAVTTFCIGYILPVIAVTIVFHYATHNNRLIDPRLSRQFIKNLKVKLYTGLVFASIAIGFSFFYPLVSIGILLVALISYLLPPETPVYEDGTVVEMV